MIILTEKPSVASSFAAALGVPRKGPFWENSEYCIVNALGHLLENYEPHDYDIKYKRWNLADLPIIPEEFLYKPVAKTVQQLTLVSQCLKAHAHDVLLLATDAEREGELIGAEILKYAGFAKYDSARRFWVSQALTKEVILSGIKNSRPLAEYESYKIQGYARQQADWLSGINLTRLISLQSGLPLSFGRVQTAVLAAVYEREDGISRFAKEKYVEVVAVLGAQSPFSVKLVNRENAEFPFRFPASSQALAPFSASANNGPPAASGAVTSLAKEKKTVYPPQLFNITALQKEAHKKFSFPPEKTLEIAQALYENRKCLSYPRTPSRVMGDDNAGLVQGIYASLAGLYPDLSSGSRIDLVSPANKRVFNSAQLQDHHALIPLAPLPKEASQDEGKVFSLVLARFFAVFMDPYVYNAITVDIDIAGFLFRGDGIEVLEPGWKSFAGDDGDEQQEINNLSGLAEGECYPVLSLAPREKYTQPKKHFTYASILALMENPRGEDGKHLAGLGTPATRGAILKKLIDRRYLAETGKNILITDEGKFLIGEVKKNSLLSSFVSIPETTRWEQALHESASDFLKGIAGFVSKAVKESVIQSHKPSSLGPCPRCGAGVLEGKKSYHCSAYKEGCSFSIWKESFHAPFSAEDARRLLEGKKTAVKKCKSMAGKEFRAAFFLKDGKIEPEFTKK
jgi:DNA topoisomerase-3